MHDLFEFKQTGIDENRVAKGFYAACGVRSSLMDRIEASGLSLPSDLFEKRILMKCEGRVNS
jgi:pilus assembly protein CpaF